MRATRINLLSEEKKEHLHKMVYMQFIKHLGQLILVLLCFIAVLLVSADVILHTYLDSLYSTVSIPQTRISEINKKITTTNKIIKRVDTLQNRSTVWTEINNTIFSKIPEEITLTQLNIEPKKNILIISGMAPSREEAQIFKETLESIDLIESSNLPVSQLTQQNNISFTITAILK